MSRDRTTAPQLGQLSEILSQKKKKKKTHQSRDGKVLKSCEPAQGSVDFRACDLGEHVKGQRRIQQALRSLRVSICTIFWMNTYSDC